MGQGQSNDQRVCRGRERREAIPNLDLAQVTNPSIWSGKMTGLADIPEDRLLHQEKEAKAKGSHRLLKQKTYPSSKHGLIKVL